MDLPIILQIQNLFKKFMVVLSEVNNYLLARNEPYKTANVVALL